MVSVMGVFPLLNGGFLMITYYKSKPHWPMGTILGTVMGFAHAIGHDFVKICNNFSVNKKESNFLFQEPSEPFKKYFDISKKINSGDYFLVCIQCFGTL